MGIFQCEKCRETECNTFRCVKCRGVKCIRCRIPTFCGTNICEFCDYSRYIRSYPRCKACIQGKKVGEKASSLCTCGHGVCKDCLSMNWDIITYENRYAPMRCPVSSGRVSRNCYAFCHQKGIMRKYHFNSRKRLSTWACRSRWTFHVVICLFLYLVLDSSVLSVSSFVGRKGCHSRSGNNRLLLAVRWFVPFPPFEVEVWRFHSSVLTRLWKDAAASLPVCVIGSFSYGQFNFRCVGDQWKFKVLEYPPGILRLYLEKHISRFWVSKNHSTSKSPGIPFDKLRSYFESFVLCMVYFISSTSLTTISFSSSFLWFDSIWSSVFSYFIFSGFLYRSFRRIALGYGAL